MIRFLLNDLRGSMANRSLWVFCASLFLGIVLIATCSTLLQLVRAGLDAQARELFGGDAQVSARAPIEAAELDWLSANGTVSRLTELRTMVGTRDRAFTVIELQSVDEAYPLYGSVRLQPAMTLAEAVAQDGDGVWGAAFDPALTVELGIEPGDRVTLGELEVELRAAVVEQPDRSLRADVRGPPILVDQAALEASGLAGPMSVVDFDYRVRLDGRDTAEWRDALREAFPEANWEVRTIEERGEFVAERLEQVASVLLLIGLATLLIGGLGVANGMRAYLELKRPTLATLQALGARGAQVVLVFVGQSVLMAAGAAGAGALAGAAIAWFVGAALAERLPIDAAVTDLLAPAALVWLFGVLAALAFALPALGQALARRPAQLLRSGGPDAGAAAGASVAQLPARFAIATGVCALAAAGLLLILVPQPLIGIAFLVAAVLLFAALHGIARLIESGARRLSRSQALQHRFVLRHAVDGLCRPGSALRPMLLSLGISLTVLAASALVIAALERTLLDSVPARAPALVFYDIQDPELDAFEAAVREQPEIDELITAPLVLGRLAAVNGERLADSEDSERAFEGNDEHKLSRRVSGIDATRVARGAWWADDYSGPPLVAMEDREAEQLGLQVGDELRFVVQDRPLEATLAAIYEQATLETRFWFEAVFSPGVIDPFVTRHVGSAWLREAYGGQTGGENGEQADVRVTYALGQSFPTVVSIRTARALESARAVLAAASLAVTLVAAVSLIASVLVMASVVAVNRHRRTFEVTVLHAIGARMGRLLRATLLEYALMGAVVVIFASVVGGLLGHLLLVSWIELPSAGARFAAPLTAAIAATLCLGGAAWWLAHGLKASPASLLRNAG